VRDQLNALEELARTDLAIRQADVDLTDIRARLDELRTDVDRIRDLLDRERQQLQEAEKLRAEHADALQQIDEKSVSTKRRADVAKNAREAEATRSALEVLRREKDERSQETARIEAAIAQVRDQIGRHEGDFVQLGEMLQGEERAAQARSEEIVGRKREVELARQSISSRVRPDILRIYAMVFSKRGNSVAEITNGVCRGCHISLPPQLYNQILRAERVYQCPNCQRILMPPASAR
jgi:predicted  nucleic acid-binding Zn-ribbon protein